MSRILEGAFHDLLSRIKKLSNRLIDAKIEKNLDAKFIRRTHDLLDSLSLKVQKVINNEQLDAPFLADDYLRNFRQLNDECTEIETYRCLIIHSFGDAEIYFNKLIRRIFSEIRYVGNRPIPLLTTSTAPQNYYWVHTKHDLIGVPPGEEHNLLHIPDIYHEIAHIIFLIAQTSLNYNWVIGRFPQDVTTYFTNRKFLAEERNQPREYITKLDTWHDMWIKPEKSKWLEEFACDLIATYLVGPAYAWTHLKLVISEGKATYDLYNITSENHPADEARMRAIRYMLFELGQSDAINQLDQAWDLVLQTYKKKPTYYDSVYPDELLEKFAQTVYRACSKQTLQSYRQQIEQQDPPLSALLNEAWMKLHASPDTYASWEKQTILELRRELD
ncbi:hypothetical protein [Spirosoma oryzicola]|uniref:hypothetical protein n=1 Tax=Spirosoma oryzicola TaxID=2898794 RepID=UPI001E3C8E50|nr:hypothetical protein [Spirosoma oryzicola]UHG94673.1 hypothetical protein LQ777_29185 [Spirosoma oryzicola]